MPGSEGESQKREGERGGRREREEGGENRGETRERERAGLETQLIKISIITTLIDAAECHMRCHMEKPPQRPPIIDSPRWCTQLGTFTNKGRPINISG